jgi:hypothetical protein
LAITTYAELLSAIQNYEEDTSSIVADRDDEWVTLAEQRIHYGSGVPGSPFYSPALRVRMMEQPFTIRIEANQDGGTSGGSADAQTVTLATTPTVALGLTITFIAGFTNTGAMTLNPNSQGAVAIRKGVNNDAMEAGDIVLGATYTVYYDGTFYKLIPEGGAPLPARFLGFKHIYDDGDRKRPLDQIAAQHLIGMAGANSSGSPIRGYAIDGDAIRFVPPTDGTRFIRGTYYRRFAALSTELNELFRRTPSVYLYGALLEASLYLGDDENMGKWHGAFMSACQGVAASDQWDRYGSAPLQMRAPGPDYP